MEVNELPQEQQDAIRAEDAAANAIGEIQAVPGVTFRQALVMDLMKTRLGAVPPHREFFNDTVKYLTEPVGKKKGMTVEEAAPEANRRYNAMLDAAASDAINHAQFILLTMAAAQPLYRITPNMVSAAVHDALNQERSVIDFPVNRGLIIPN